METEIDTPQSKTSRISTSRSARRAALDRVEPDLPAAWFRDPAHYRRELDAFWFSRWIACGRESEIAESGAYSVVVIGDQSIVLVRGDDGELRGFHNTCRHRGSVLCTEAAGRFAGDRIVCPYHAWTYDLAGRLARTPRRMASADFDPRAFSLFAVGVATWGGFVFVHLGETDSEPPRRRRALAASLGDVPQRFTRYRFERLQLGKRIVLDVAANWKLLAENFAECFHCPPVHPELCRIVTAYQEAGAWGLRSDARGRRLTESKAEYKAGAVTLSLDGTARIPPFADLTAAERAILYTPVMLPPNLFLNVHPDYLHTHYVFPTGPTSVRVVYDWLFEPEALAGASFDLDHYVALWEIVNRQDARNCEWQQVGMRSRAFRHGVFVPQEFDCHRFAQWVRRGLRAKPARAAK